MRNWIKSIVREVIREEIKQIPLLICARPPCPDDVYQPGTTWKHGNDLYIAKKCTVEWEKQ